ncbi:MAG: hypothetical protein WCA20_11165 [Candidatus Sulfotelmatobacter sp.]
MRREDLMKPDPLSNILLLSSGIVIVAALVTLMVLALVHAASAFSTTSPSATYSLLPICCQSDSPYNKKDFSTGLIMQVDVHNAVQR